MNRKITYILSLLIVLISSCLNAVNAEEVLRIEIKKDGVYYISNQDLIAAGIPTNTDPKTFKIFNQGVEIPIYVYGEDTTNTISPSIYYIEFYAKGISRESEYYEFTDANIYWLKWGGEKGKRVTPYDGTPGNLSPPASFLAGLHAENDLTFWLEKPDSDENDHWFWEKIKAGESMEYQFQLKNIDTTSSDCAVRVSLHGRTDVFLLTDHNTRIYLNNHPLNSGEEWDGMVPKKWDFTGIPCNLFNEDENRIKIEALRVPVSDTYKEIFDLDSDGFLDIDSSYLNWFEVDYRSKYITENGYYLSFSATGNSATDFALSGFRIPTYNSGWIALLDITGYPDKINRFNNIGLSDNLTQVYFRDVLENNKKKEYAATVILTNPAKITKYNRINKWRNTANNADYVIITHDDLYDSALRLAEYRKNQGLKAAVVRISEVYDEFSDGIFTPRAIKDFLVYAYTSWSLRPKYVVLFGDANYDYKDNYKYGEPNMIPTYFVPGEFGLIPTDNWFVDVNGDVAPEMMIGRISVKNLAEANSVIDKIINYESAQEAYWYKNILFVADEDDYAFEYISDTLYLSLPPEYSATAQKVYMSNYYKSATDPEKAGELARADIAAIINSGTLMTIYAGHGDVDQWTDEDMINSYYVSGWGTESILSNYEMPTFVMTLNCLNGFFPLPNEGGVKNKYEPNDIPLAEAFLKLDRRGAVAVWSPTSLGYTWEHEILARHVFDAVFKEGINVVGEAILKAKTTAYQADNISKDIIYMYTLFGDPATRLHLSVNPAGGGTSSSESNKDSGSGGGGCFIATAAYGSPLHPYLKYLRDFRDTYLMTNNPGRAFVHQYYRYSPPVAQYIAERPLLRMFISITLLPLVGVAWLLTTFYPLQIVIAFLLIAGVVMGGILFVKKFCIYSVMSS